VNLWVNGHVRQIPMACFNRFLLEEKEQNVTFVANTIMLNFTLVNFCLHCMEVYDHYGCGCADKAELLHHLCYCRPGILQPVIR
jgi:hypothetical protein